MNLRSAAAGGARRLLRHIGRRGAFLGFLALLDVVVGFALRQPLPLGLTQRDLYEPFMAVMPLWWWVAWWWATAALVGVAAVVRHLRPAAFGFAALLKTGWACGYLVGWVQGLPLFIRGYAPAATWLAFAAFVLVVAGWSENDHAHG